MEAAPEAEYPEDRDCGDRCESFVPCDHRRSQMAVAAVGLRLQIEKAIHGDASCKNQIVSVYVL